MYAFSPCIGDFSIHGSIYAHLLRDPIPGKVTQTEAPLVASWCERMAGHVFESKHLDFWDVEDGQLVKRPFKTDFLEKDEIPETLIPILKQITFDMEQNLYNTMKQVEDFLATKPKGGKLPKPITKVSCLSIQYRLFCIDYTV